MTAVSASQLRASLIFRGPKPPVRSWDLVCLLRLDDRQLTTLHQRLSLAHRRGEDLTTVPLPAGVSRYQRELMALAVAALPVQARSLDRRQASAPTAAQAEARLERLMDRANQAQRQAEAWPAAHGKRH